MTIGRICQREVDLADANETAHAVGSGLGARADRDLAIQVVGRGHDPREIRVKDLMTTELRTVAEDAPIEEALAAMRREGVRRLPVVGWNDQLVGVISLDDILALLAEELGQMGAVLEKTSPRTLAAD